LLHFLFIIYNLSREYDTVAVTDSPSQKKIYLKRLKT